jgi:DNA-3-methyladenine glycosylase I
MPARCPWCGEQPFYVAYHDEEWGVPCHDDRTLLEFLVLEGAQAGLSWITILRKRESYRRAFADFDAKAIAQFGDSDFTRLLADPGIVRNRLKITAAIANAKAFLDVQKEFGSFDAWIWRLAGGDPTINRWQTMEEIPVETESSIAMSRELRRRGFKFVGPTICYAFMQAVGMVNDHLVSCHRHPAFAFAGVELR